MDVNSKFGSLLDSYLRHEPRRSIPVTLRRRENLYLCGDSDEYVYLIVTGHLKSVAYTMQGKGCLLDLYSRLDIVGESCLLSSTRHETTTAMSDVSARKIPRKWFLDVLSDHGLFENYVQYLAERLFEQQEHITRLVTCDSEQRLAATLLKLARRNAPSVSEWVSIDQRITQEELAEMVGTTRSRIGYFLKRLRERTLVHETQDSCLAVHQVRLGRAFGFLDESSSRSAV